MIKNIFTQMGIVNSTMVDNKRRKSKNTKSILLKRISPVVHPENMNRTLDKNGNSDVLQGGNIQEKSDRSTDKEIVVKVKGGVEELWVKCDDSSGMAAGIEKRKCLTVTRRNSIASVAEYNTTNQKPKRLMEWQIMNCGGLNSVVIGTWVDGEYRVSEDSYEALSSILCQLKEDEQTTRCQLAASLIIQKDLVPLVTGIEDDPAVFSLAVKLLVSLTQPIESSSSSQGLMSPKSVASNPQFWEISKMLLDAKVNCTGPKFTWAIIREVKKIIMDTGQDSMSEGDCETINQCLLLVRNLLYIQDTVGEDDLSPAHLGFLKNLFQMGIDYVLVFVLNAKQKDFWGATVAQVLSLLYRDLIGEIFLRFDNTDNKCCEEPCDSYDCPACEAAMDRATILEPYLKTSIYRSSRNSKSQQSCSKCGDDTVISQPNFPEQSSSGSTSPALNNKFDKSCTMAEPVARQKEFGDNTKQKAFNEDSSDDRGSSSGSCDSPDTLQSEDSEVSVVEELGTCLIDFTTKFLQMGFSNLVHVQKMLLLKNGDVCNQSKLDDSYFLWSIAFFLKFARRKELKIEFKNIKDVFTADVVGFLVFKAFSNGEEVFLLNKNNMGKSLAMKRLHLCVSALRELFKTLSQQLTQEMSEDDRQYLKDFQKNLANMSDLRQLFLWLIRLYDPDCQNTQFLQDTIITNHYFLMLLEVWIEQGLCTDSSINMLTHINQFATPQIMKNYGLLLQNFDKNDHHVNNCIFTMMHHIAGDCNKSDALLHPSILNTFIQMWDSNYPVTQVMNDLMEYVVQKFIRKAEKSPLECALQMLEEEEEEDLITEQGGDKMEEASWTSEEEDKLIMWYSDLEDSPDFVEKLVECFDEIGILKTKTEIVNKLYESNWLAPGEVKNVIMFNKDLEGLQDPCASERSDDETLQYLSELFAIQDGDDRDSTMDPSDVEDDEKVVLYLVDTLRSQGLDKQLKFIQKTLLEAAYVKLDKTDKDQVEEPIMKHCVDIKQPIPLAPFSDDNDVICNNMYMRLLLQQLGFYVSCERRLTQASPYPRMPHEWTTAELVEKAQLLGDITQGDVKFELDSVTTKRTKPVSINKDKNSFSES